MKRGGTAWLALAALLGICAMLGWRMPHASIDWEPSLAASQPWRALSAVGVHYGRPHLLGNLGGLALTGLLGWVARMPARMALAWALAWPLTQLGLWLEPELTHYGGLSGVLHAGVAVVGTALLSTGTRAQRIVATLLLAGLAVKLVSESPWSTPLRQSAVLGIAVAPMAHLLGAVAGVACAVAADRLPRRPLPSV